MLCGLQNFRSLLQWKHVLKKASLQIVEPTYLSSGVTPSFLNNAGRSCLAGRTRARHASNPLPSAEWATWRSEMPSGSIDMSTSLHAIAGQEVLVSVVAASDSGIST